MKNLFELSEEEKNQIRGLHESYKSKPGTSLIWEQDAITPQSSEIDVYYFGVDSFRKGHHYYPECTSVFMDPETLNTDDIYDYNHKCSNYLKESRQLTTHAYFE